MCHVNQSLGLEHAELAELCKQLSVLQEVCWQKLVLLQHIPKHLDLLFGFVGNFGLRY